ncbi:MAG: hypothetical protein AAF572_05940 [Cyanobacteria bacterium P01_B01_bin.77]
MAYSDFTINDVRKQFAIELVEDQALFSDVEPQVPPQWLSDFLDILFTLG